MIEFSESRVYTVTCTCRSGEDVEDLETLARALRLEEAADAIGVVSCKSPSGIFRGAASSKKPRARAFGRQITLGVRCTAQERAIHVKLFGNGTLQTAGALTPAAAYEACALVCRACGFAREPVDLTVRMINSGFRASCRLNLLACFEAARDAGMMVSYDPCCYSALKISLFFDRAGTESHSCTCAHHCATKRPRNRLCRMVTVSVFESGAIGVSGGVTDEHVRRASDLVKRAISGCTKARQLGDDEIIGRLRALRLGLEAAPANARA